MFASGAIRATRAASRCDARPNARENETIDYAAADARVAAGGAGAHAMMGVFGATSVRAAARAGGRVDALRDAS